MKKQVLRKWVEYLLGAIMFMAFCIMGSECEDLMLFITSHLIAAGVFVLCGMVIIKYGREQE